MYSNCILFAYYRRVTQGGRVQWSKSRTWKGFHTTWVDKNNCEWEFTLDKPKKQPWWYIPLLYKGVVKKVCNES